MASEELVQALAQYFAWNDWLKKEKNIILRHTFLRHRKPKINYWARKLESYNTIQFNGLWDCFKFVCHMAEFLIFVYVVCILLASILHTFITFCWVQCVLEVFFKINFNTIALN